MSKIFAILTAVILVASAYVALKNKEMYKVEIDNREVAESSLKTNQERYQRATDDRDSTVDERTAIEEETVAQQKVESEQEAKNASLKSAIEEGSEIVAANQKVIDDFREKTKELGALGEIAGKIERMSNEIAVLEDDKGSKTAVLNNLIGERENTKGTIKVYNDQNTAVSNQKSYFDSTRITGIFGNWGFVTLGAGNSSGVVSGSRLDVVRDGEVVAKLQVRSVEAGRASADIVPDSLVEDTVLMVGDRVVPTTENEVGAQASN
ncbi:MAG: hypothetical protein ACQKBU_11520 [Verrucomicrobiales bacterium]